MAVTGARVSTTELAAEASTGVELSVDTVRAASVLTRATSEGTAALERARTSAAVARARSDAGTGAETTVALGWETVVRGMTSGRKLLADEMGGRTLKILLSFNLLLLRLCLRGFLGLRCRGGNLLGLGLFLLVSFCWGPVELLRNSEGTLLVPSLVETEGSEHVFILLRKSEAFRALLHLVELDALSHVLRCLDCIELGLLDGATEAILEAIRSLNLIK